MRLALSRTLLVKEPFEQPPGLLVFDLVSELHLERLVSRSLYVPNTISLTAAMPVAVFSRPSAIPLAFSRRPSSFWAALCCSTAM